MINREPLFGRLCIVDAIILVAAILLLAACGGSDSEYETVQEATLTTGDAVPAPTGDVILTITGDINNINKGDSLVFDMETLESLELVRYTVSDPWQQTEIAYTGVLLSDLLAVAGAGEGATAVNVIALNDYAAEVPISESDKWPVMIATQSDGEYMTIDNTGPTRIIFPYDTYDDISAARNMSVWNIGSMEVK
jgi:hypothetical protein